MVAAARQPRSERSAMIAKLHIAKKQLGLDDDVYREALQAATGKRSAGDMSEPELAKALKHFQKRGFSAKAGPTPGPSPRGGGEPSFADSVYLPKVRALWLSGWHLGVVRDRSDGAMAAFIKRQTGIESTRWLTRAEDARVVVEALKSWFAREAGVDWGDAHEGNPRRAVVWAQFRRLVALGAFMPQVGGELHRSDVEGYGYRVTGKAAFHFYEAADWDKLIRAAGAKLRAAMARQGAPTPDPSPQGGGEQS